MAPPRSLALALLLWVGSLGPAPAAAGGSDLGPLLDALEAPTARARAEAERALAGALHFDAGADLVAALEGRGDEVLLRVASALAARDGLLEVAATLATDPREDLARIGRMAIEGAVDRWAPGLQPFLVGDTVLDLRLRELEGRDRSRRYLVPAALDLERVVELLARAARLPLPVVVDPALAEAPPAAASARETIEGTWTEVFDALRRSRGVDVGGLIRVDLDGADQLIGLLLTRDELVAASPPASLFARWVLQVASERDPQARRAAVALATSGWPAAVRWLGERHLRRGDRAAREGLLAAARRGVHVADLSVRDAYTRLVDDARGAVAAGEPPASGLLEGLAGAGARLSDGGSAFDELLADAGAEDPRWSFHALAVCARIGAPSGRLVEVAGALLSDPGTPAEVAIAALEAWSACQRGEPPAPTPPAIDGLLARAVSPGAARALLRALLGAGCAPPPRVFELDGWLPSAVAVAWLWQAGAADEARATLAQALARHAGDGQALREMGELLALLGPVVLGSLGELTDPLRGEQPSGLAADRVAAHGGWLPAIRQGPLLIELERAGLARSVDPFLLASLVRGPAGDRARELLLERLSVIVGDPGLHDARVVEALREAVWSLLEAERDLEAQSLRAEAIGLTRLRPGAPAAEAIRSGAWPGAPDTRAEDLADEGLTLALDLPGPVPAEPGR